MASNGHEGQPALTETRRARVVELLEESGEVSIAELQARFGVSPMTARRDLTILAERGVVRRTHGGAVLPAIAAAEHSFHQRLREAPEIKAALAEAAFSLLQAGETVFLDASSTTFFLARRIAESALPVRVLTNSLPVLYELSNCPEPGPEIIAVGGAFRRLTSSYVGPTAVRTIREHFADRFFLSVTGVSRGGVMTDVDVLEAEVKQVMLEQAETSVLLLDGAKTAAHGRQAIAPIRDVTLVLSRLGATVRATDDGEP
jgi:DeoR/GlpR family transcriptional regulator of sugar metabolism